MATTIAQRELRNDNAKVMNEVERGETFVITRNGVPIAELSPIGHGPRRFVPKELVVGTAGRSPRIDTSRFRADTDAIADPSAW